MIVFPRLKAGGYDLKPASLARWSPADWTLVSGKLYLDREFHDLNREFHDLNRELRDLNRELRDLNRELRDLNRELGT